MLPALLPALPPLDLGLAHDLISQTRVHRLLAGYRDRPRADLNKIALILEDGGPATVRYLDLVLP